jgi:hypothetical protein
VRRLEENGFMKLSGLRGKCATALEVVLLKSVTKTFRGLLGRVLGRLCWTVVSVLVIWGVLDGSWQKL